MKASLAMHSVVLRGRARSLPFLSLLLLIPTSTFAGTPRLAFDFGRAIACQVVPTESGSEEFAEEKLIQFTLPISVQLLSGDMAQVKSVRIELTDRDQRMFVHDFQPQTRLESQHTEAIERTHSTEESHSLSATLGGEAPVPVGNLVAHVTPSASGALGKREAVTQTERLLPPKQVVVASGTKRNRHGVFFQLRPTPQTTLEGVHEIALTLRVPKHWRGDTLRVEVTAQGVEKFLWMNREATLAQESGHIALYLAGDREARLAAEEYLRQ